MIDEIDKRTRRESESVEWNKLLNYVAKYRPRNFFSGEIMNLGRIEEFFTFRVDDLLQLVQEG